MYSIKKNTDTHYKYCDSFFLIEFVNCIFLGYRIRIHYLNQRSKLFIPLTCQ